MYDIMSHNFHSAPATFTYNDQVELVEYTGRPVTPKGMEGATEPPPPLPIPPRVNIATKSSKNTFSYLPTIS